MADRGKFTVVIFTIGALFWYPFSLHAAQVFEPCVVFPNSPDCLGDRDAVIVVPGIVGSFNLLSLFADKNGGIWGPVPFFKIYQGLIMRLEAEGYVGDKDLFMAYYDWRQVNTQSAEEFLDPIIEKAKEKTGRVDIIAHSMGGLLVQQYINSAQYEPGEIDQFVMLGTPNEGASAAYLPWEGGVFPTTWSTPVRFYMNNIHNSLKEKRKIQELPPKSYRQIFPSIKELLPVGNYLKKNDSEQTSSERNTFLEALIDARDDLLNSGIGVTTIAGTENSTLGTVELLGTRSEADEQLDRWRDGHPVQEVPTPNNPEGDKTVLKSSALFGPNQVNVGNVSHNALPEYAQDEALAAIGIVSNKPKIFTYQEPKYLTGFVVLSPVDIAITDSTGKTVSKSKNDFGDDAYIDVEGGDPASTAGEGPKIIILRNLPEGTYTVHLTGTDTGPYTVIVTHTDEETTTTKTLTGSTMLSKQEVFTVNIGETGATVSEITSNTRVGGEALRQAQGKGEEKDCCPGHDPEVKAGKKGKVLGATTKQLKKNTIKRRKVAIEKLKPLNQVFFEVYERMPTYDEWKYWADRYLTDKGDWEVLKGTMMWWKIYAGTSPAI